MTTNIICLYDVTQCNVVGTLEEPNINILKVNETSWNQGTLTSCWYLSIKSHDVTRQNTIIFIFNITGTSNLRSDVYN